MEPTPSLADGLSYTSAIYTPHEVLYPYGYDPPLKEPLPTPSNRVLFLAHTEKLRILQVDIEQQLQQLSMAHQNVSHAIEYHCAVVAPARRLPEDVLIEIFGHCLQAESTPVSAFSNRNVSCTLSYVCHKWRTAVLSTPLLWPRRLIVAVVRAGSDMSINIDAGGAPPRSAINLLELHLDRSHPLPLEIWLAWDIPEESSHLLQQWGAPAIFRRLFQCASRFTCLHVDFIDSQTVSSYPTPDPLLPTITFSRLQSVRFGDLVRGDHSLPTWLVNPLTHRAPHLRDFRTIGAALPFTLPLKTTLSFLHQITSLHLGRDNDYTLPNIALFFLVEIPNLEECRLFISTEYGPITTTPRRPTTLTLPRLRVFHAINEHQRTTDLKLLSRLVLPSLEELLLMTENRPACIRRLIRDSRCQLTSLTLNFEANDPDTDDMAALLREVPALKTLQIISARPENGDSYIRRLGPLPLSAELRDISNRLYEDPSYAGGHSW